MSEGGKLFHEIQGQINEVFIATCTAETNWKPPSKQHSTLHKPGQEPLGEPGKGRSTQEEAPPSGVRTGGDWQLQIVRAQKSRRRAPEMTNPGSDFLHRRRGRGFGKWMSAWKLWLSGFRFASRYFYLSLSRFWRSVSVAFGAFSQPPTERQILDPAHSWTH